ncbi:pitrilysin family protein [Siphonobacter sp. SORGH_AS_1065]|uniref:M16 family metallopeptidase n=1 Tax=Siphonobacter sp. SORGH_AS_1065 TaxID=3041795 RepID=UPI0027833128|nr:pitrilysin family protein [Siphonobacter sp. SORGH_AS_1065]MDQ1086036.1 zinc protease [Siphonobacter sp. SORGH_AS_1065]
MMMQLDRTQAPDFHLTDTVSLLPVQAYTLDNHIPVYVIDAGEQPVTRVEWVFEAGGWDEALPNVSTFTLRMLNEGTQQYTGAELAEFFDQYGSFLELGASADRSTVTLYALRKHLPVLLPRIQELLQEATFPAEELEVQRTIALQNLQVNEEKTSFLASRGFREALFGKDHPYGKNQTQENLKAFSREDLVTFYQNHIAGHAFQLFISGQVDEREVALVNEIFGQQALLPQPERRSFELPIDANPAKVLIELPEKTQSTLRMGKRMINRVHHDYYKVLVTNEIFGGYFGSRLMKNIREEKGFTYGIYSQMNNFAQASQLVIGTDVNKEFTSQTLAEIKKESERLQTELVSETELQTAQNYMIGQFIGSLNTPFEIADRHKVRILNNLPDDYHLRFIERIKAVTKEDVLAMAQAHFQWKDLVEVVAGGK